MSSIQRLYVAEDLHIGATFNLTFAQVHYVKNVLRLNIGDEILLFNGRDGEWRACLTEMDKKRVLVKTQEQIRVQTQTPDIWLLVAPIKRARLDYLISKATEMGVSRIQFVLTEYTQKPAINYERLTANAIEAAEQCGILNIPEIAEVASLEDVVRNWQDSRALIFCDESQPNAVTDWQNLNLPCAVLIGPEGGFSETERALIRAHSATHILSLGTRILRTDTAVVAACALIQNYIGDWYN